jgi:hypothetical protein
VAKDKGDKGDDAAKPKKVKRARTLGPATIARPALIGAGVLLVLQLALRG